MLDGVEMKYTVLKNEDVVACGMQYRLQAVSDLVTEGRKKAGKATDNKYIVINTDEPYIDEVVAILKRHGHWGR